MRILIVVPLLSLLLAGSAEAQSSRPVPTPRTPGPFSSEWAKPYPQTGGYIYMDPRLRDYEGIRGRGRSSTACPPPLLWNPSTGSCR
jgi:hypothetical protein